MAWYTVPGLIVPVLTIFQIFVNGKKVDVESVKREILIILIKGLLISIPIYLLEMVMLFSFIRIINIINFTMKLFQCIH